MNLFRLKKMDKISQLAGLEFIDSSKRAELKAEIGKDIQNVQSVDALGSFVSAAVSVMSGDTKDSNVDLKAS